MMRIVVIFGVSANKLIFGVSANKLITAVNSMYI